VGCIDIIFSPTILVYEQGNTKRANFSSLRCVFWNFTLTQDGLVNKKMHVSRNLIVNISHSVTGGWDTNNVVVYYRNDTFITCNSSHLTSFAVLVDVSGKSKPVHKS